MGLFKIIGRGYVAYQALGLFVGALMVGALAILSLINGNLGAAAFLTALGGVCLYLGMRIKRSLESD